MRVERQPTLLIKKEPTAETRKPLRVPTANLSRGPASLGPLLSPKEPVVEKPQQRPDEAPPPRKAGGMAKPRMDRKPECPASPPQDDKIVLPTPEDDRARVERRPTEGLKDTLLRTPEPHSPLFPGRGMQSPPSAIAPRQLPL